VGRWLVMASLALSAVSLVSLGAELARANCEGWHIQRAQILAALREQGGRHLVIVRYAPDHSPHDEWVYNDADIDGSPVVWARDLGPEQNQRLLEYYAHRRVWLLEPDVASPELVPYGSHRTPQP
jgi:hypothetical protein